MTSVTLARPDVDFLITNGCPSACRHCVFGAGRRLTDELDTDGALLVLRRIRETFGVAWISLSGGEPLSRPDFGTLYREAAAIFDVTLISTGLGLTEQHRHLLAECPPRQAIVSLYGIGSDHDEFCRNPGAYAATMRYLECLQSLRAGGTTSVAVNVVCYRGNLDRVARLLHIVSRDGLADEVKLLALSPVGRGAEIAGQCVGCQEWLRFAESVRQLLRAGDFGFNKPVRIERHVGEAGSAELIPACYVVGDEGSILRSCVHVDANGDVYPCTMLVRRPEYRLGNLRDGPALDVHGVRIRARNARERLLRASCTDCPSCSSCLKGCFGYQVVLGRDYRCNGSGYHLGCPDRYVPLLEP